MAEPEARGPQRSTEPLAYFEAVYEAAHKAAHVVGGFVDHFLEIAHHSIQLRFVGPALVPHTLRALAHVRTEPTASPELTVHIWDSASTGTMMPPLTWNAANQLYRGEVRGYNNERFLTTYNAWADTLSMVDGKLNRAVFWLADAKHVHFSTSWYPLRNILYWWMQGRGVQLVHGAGVGTREAGVLLAGRGSSGKSTAALACINSGLLYAGDDLVLASPKPRPFLYSLYNTALLDVGGRYSFSDVIPGIENPQPLHEAKSRIFLYEHFPERVATGFPLRAIVVPEATGGMDTKLRRASAAQTLMALAPATIYMLPQAGEEALRRMTRLVGSLPNYVLELGTDLCQIPRVISSLLSGDHDVACG